MLAILFLESITTDDVIFEQVFDDLKGTDIGNEVAAIQTCRRLSNTSNNRVTFAPIIIYKYNLNYPRSSKQDN